MVRTAVAREMKQKTTGPVEKVRFLLTFDEANWVKQWLSIID
jgi:hypothetical protein